MLVLALWAALAAADEPAETVVVESQRNLAATWARVDEAVRAQGYLPGVRIGERTVYVPRQIWEPPVVLFDDGRVKARGHAITPFLIIPGPSSIQIHGLWGSPREARGSEREILEALEAPLREHRSATQELALAERIAALEGQLAALWFEGRTAEGALLAGWPERRAGIVALWLHTADNDAGARIRERIERFVDEEVQSVEPFTDLELADANRRRGFPGELTPAQR